MVIFILSFGFFFLFVCFRNKAVIYIFMLGFCFVCFCMFVNYFLRFAHSYAEQRKINKKPNVWLQSSGQVMQNQLLLIHAHQSM